MTFKKPAEEQSADSGASAIAPVAASAAVDVALIHGVTPDGEGLKILRARGDRVELGAVRPLREGVPITGEVVTLRPRANFPALCDVETHFKPPAEGSDSGSPEPPSVVQRTGPAQVATDEYRRNWDAIWNRSSGNSKLSN